MSNLGLVIVSLRRGYETYGTHIVDDEIKITCRNHLPRQQPFIVLNSANTPTSLLHNHHLLDHFLLISIQEIRKFPCIQRGIQFQETA